MQTNSQRRERACDFCGEGVAPLYPVVTAEVASGEGQKRMVCHTCRSLGHGRPIVVAADKTGTRWTQDGDEDGKQPQEAMTVARTRAKQAKAR